ncbi:MAG: putative ribonuclease VapC [Candidatus Amesbacteria bacterium GW2011_GWA2_42_12]|uniref:Ribonuclease VapC n=1 Tax=Candidatus Amesbacteria bacterium GW2011_GWA2_42_12 TaxID=1618356 RepID=A0A0G1B368_9BACT|nr:MAG: putative ribonuclease VapC [Candidatus Amesbacteria bacterium GW2011_GWA2_42_12]
MKLVCDTSIFIDKLRGGKRWDEFVESVEGDVNLYLPTIVVFELYSGKSTKRAGEVKKLNQVIKYFERVELTEQIARRAGEIYRDGVKDLQVPDYVIAATALELGAEVMTLNRKHFAKIPGVRVFEF